MLALIAVWLACFRDYEPYLASGEVATIPVLAADRRQARTIMRYITGLMHDVPMLAAMITDETTDSIEINHRVVIEIHTASYRSLRSYTCAAILADEIAFYQSSETSKNLDEDILAAARPGLTTIPGAILLYCSSPYAQKGVLWSAYRKHWGQDDSRVLVFKGSSLELNPTIDPEIVATALAEDPEKAKAEYFADFRSDIATFISREVVDAVTAPGRYQLPCQQGVRYVAHTDPSGGSSDSWTCAIAHLDADGTTAVLDVMLERKPPFSPEAVVADYAAMLKSYGITRVQGDAYAGFFPRELFAKHGIEYDVSKLPASDIYREILPAIMSRQVELLDNPRMLNQLVNLERRTGRSGRDLITHSQGSHDDAINSAAAALLLAKSERPALVISDEFLAWSRGGAQRRLVF